MFRNLLIIFCLSLLIFSCSESDSPSGPTILPVEVSELQATPADGSVTLTWVDPDDIDFHHVEITFSPTVAGIAQPISVQKDSQTKSITGLTNGETYDLTIKITDGDGNKSNGVSIQTLIGVPPAEVTELRGESSDGSVTLTWVEPPDDDFDHVVITFTPTVAEISQPISVSKGTQTSNFTGLTNDTTYTFTLKTVDNSDNRSSGLTISVTPEIPPIEQGSWIGIISNTTYRAVYFAVSGDKITGRTTVKFPFTGVTIECYIYDDINIRNSRFSYTRGIRTNAGGKLTINGTFTSGNSCTGTATYDEDSFAQRAYMNYDWVGSPSSPPPDSSLALPEHEIILFSQVEINEDEDMDSFGPELKSLFERVEKIECLKD